MFTKERNDARTVSTMFLGKMSDLLCNHDDSGRFRVNPGSKVTPLLTGFQFSSILHDIEQAILRDPGTGLRVTCKTVPKLVDVVVLGWLVQS